MTPYMSLVKEKTDNGLRKWLQSAQDKPQLDTMQADGATGPYVAISRETGAGGSEVARLVAEKLDWVVLDNAIVDYLACQYGTDRRLVDLVDERHISWIEDVFASWIENQAFTSETYAHRLILLLQLAARHGNVVIVGRGAPFVLPHNSGISVRILAPFEFRVEQVMLHGHFSAKEARRLVRESDRQREAFVWEHFHRDPGNPHLYDLVVSVDKLGIEDAAELIAGAVRSWMKRR